MFAPQHPKILPDAVARSCDARRARGNQLRGLIGFLLGAVTIVGPAAADPYDDYRAFAELAFGGESHPLVVERFGAELEPPIDWWVHLSQFSASVGFSTNRLARSTVEYGPTLDYGQATPTSDGQYSKHLHHLTDLRPGTVYHYRVILEGTQGQRVVSEDRTLVPVETKGAIWIPDDLSGPPYLLGLPNTRYLVTENLVTPGTAFEVSADGVELDLGGHTVIYDQQALALDGPWTLFREQSSFGIRARGADRLRVFNGSLHQGAAGSGAHPRQSIGFNPVYVESSSDVELAGVVLEYRGSQMVGLYLHWPGGASEIHHNVFRDRGWEITNRHGMGSRALGVTGEIAGLHTHHNLVQRTRQSGLQGAVVHDNEIHIDSYATNSYGLPALRSHREAYGNRIYGTGYHVVGFGWGNANWWHDNFVHLVGQGPDYRYQEYGNQESLNGFRLTQYDDATEELVGSRLEGNLVLIEGGGCSDDGECTKARGLQYSSDPYVVDNLIRNNVFCVVMEDDVTQAAALVTQGQPARCGTEAPVRYVGNTLISNVLDVRMGDYYGSGCNHRFYDTHMVRVGDRADYRTLAFDAPAPTREQYFFDTTFEGGASYDLLEFSHPQQELRVGWTLIVHVTLDGKAVRATRVVLRDSTGAEIASGVTDAEGRFGAPVVTWSQTRAGRATLTPVAIEVVYEGRHHSRSVELDSPSEVEVRVGSAARSSQ